MADNNKKQSLVYNEAFEKQREAMERYAEEHPELMVRANEPIEEDILKEVGIGALPRNRQPGYLRLFVHDFIVEEVLTSGEVVEVESKEESPDNLQFKEKEKTLYADLVKAGVAHFDILRSLSEKFDMPQNKIGYAGLKDKIALTSQRVALRSLDPTKPLTQAIPGAMLKHFEIGKGSIQPGDLKGNRFTITIRTKDPVDQEWLFESLAYLEQEGCLNYYNTQRFGGMRLMAHKLGAYMFRGEYSKAVEEALCYSSPYEVMLIKKKREQARDDYPNFEKIFENYNELPYTFRIELRLLDHLLNDPDDAVGALLSVPDQAGIWGKAYTSYLFNSYLTARALAKKPIPEGLPILSAKSKKSQDIYRPWLQKHRTGQFFKHIKPFSYLVTPRKSKPQETKIYPKIHKAGIIPQGVILCFELPKGAYATTFLMNLFSLETGEPIPKWIQNDEIDAKATLGIGNLQKVKHELRDFMHREFDEQGNVIRD